MSSYSTHSVVLRVIVALFFHIIIIIIILLFSVPSPGSVAYDAASRKSSKYLSLSAQYCFVPIAVETLDAPGDEALAFLRFGTAHHVYNS